MFRVAITILAVVGAVYCRMPFEFADGYDYVLSSPLDSSFSCEGLPYGYYADESNNCEVFHICFPVADEIGALVETAHFSFFCPNETIFDQQSLTCAHKEEAFPCSEARNLYELSNSEFGVISDNSLDDFEKKKK